MFLNIAFLLRNCQILSDFRSVFSKFISDPELPSEIIFLDPDPAKSLDPDLYPFPDPDPQH
jgi:hypothetical protein